MENKMVGIEIKQKNRTAIFQLFLQQQEVSRQDIVEKLGLSLPTVTHNLQQLQQEGLICQSGSLDNTGGRRARLYSLVNSARCAVGLEITRHHLTLNSPTLIPLIEQWNALAPLHRLGKPEELQAIAVYLAGDASPFTTGSDFVIDGAFTCF